MFRLVAQRTAVRVGMGRERAAVPILGGQLLKASYHEAVVEHYENPRNVGSLDKKKKRWYRPCWGPCLRGRYEASVRSRR